MNVEQDLPSDSDDSDVDFVPEGEESGLSEEDTDEDVEDERSETVSKEKKTKRRKKPSDKKKKKIKRSRKDKENGHEKETVEEEKMTVISAEEEKKRADTLWADFMKDCSVPAKKETVQSNGTKSTVAGKGSLNSERNVDNKTSVSEQNYSPKKTVKQIFEFAGEKIEVEKECTSQSALPTTNARGRGIGAGPGRGRGGVGGGSGGVIASILGQVGKKNKLSTLEKSKLDWDRFKKEEGIEEDLQTFNKGKAGFLEKQDFLERADLRQFEIEKELRTSRRSNR